VRIVHVAAEAAPFSKVGGLADVAGALPAALVARGHDVTLVTPRYRDTQDGPLDGVDVVLVDRPELFDRSSIYGEPDDGERFAALADAGAVAAIDADVLHAHDWHAALACVGASVPTVLTIHNLAFHGDQPPAFAARHGLAPPPAPGDTWGGAVNLLGRGIAAATAVTTVSPTYAREILTPEFGAGHDALLRERGVTGILNGIDTARFDPATDPAIAAPFSSGNMAGREVCRRVLRAQLGLDLPAEAPIVGVVSRLTDQKGLDLLLAALPALRATGAGLVLLGSGDADVEAGFRAAAAAEPHAVAVRIGFDADLAQRIYAGCDLFCMPSRFEPCGLGQMIAMRYGALPVVRSTGGLVDTVTADRGFLFDAPDAGALADALGRAAAAFADIGRRQAMIAAAMSADHSWSGPAAAYEQVYERIGVK
jgi:starch synthase